MLRNGRQGRRGRKCLYRWLCLVEGLEWLFSGITRLLSSSSISNSFHNPYLTSSTRPDGPSSLAPPASTELTEQYGLQWRRSTFCVGRFIRRVSHWQSSRDVSVVVLASMYPEVSHKG